MNSKANDALVIGDGSEVYSEWEERRKEDPELPSEPDQIDYDDYWDSVYEATGALVRERDEAAYKLNRNISDWYCEVSNFGWRSQRGAKVFGVEGGDAPDHAIGTEFLHNILPKTDCTFYIYDDLDGAGLKIDNAHHDAPTGGEWYHCAPLAWMMMNGMWTGIQNDSDEIIPEIQEVLLMEWEHEFLDKELAEYSGQPNKSHLGNRAALDIEFSRLYKKFLARYKVVPTDNYLEELKNDLQVFFERYYASNTLDEWEDYLNGCDMEGFNAELKTFLEFYKMTPEEVAPIDLGEMKQMYESVLSDLHQD